MNLTQFPNKQLFYCGCFCQNRKSNSISIRIDIQCSAVGFEEEVEKKKHIHTLYKGIHNTLNEGPVRKEQKTLNSIRNWKMHIFLIRNTEYLLTYFAWFSCECSTFSIRFDHTHNIQTSLIALRFHTFSKSDFRNAIAVFTVRSREIEIESKYEKHEIELYFSSNTLKKFSTCKLPAPFETIAAIKVFVHVKKSIIA